MNTNYSINQLEQSLCGFRLLYIWNGGHTASNVTHQASPHPHRRHRCLHLRHWRNRSPPPSASRSAVPLLRHTFWRAGCCYLSMAALRTPEGKSKHEDEDMKQVQIHGAEINEVLMFCKWSGPIQSLAHMSTGTQGPLSLANTLHTLTIIFWKQINRLIPITYSDFNFFFTFMISW